MREYRNEYRNTNKFEIQIGRCCKSNCDYFCVFRTLEDSAFAVNAIPQYLFWYSLGAALFEIILQYTEMKEKDSHKFYVVGLISGLFSILLFFNNITDIAFLKPLINCNRVLNEVYSIICSIIIICFVIFISKLFEESCIMNNIGQSSMNFMGVEFITHNLFTLSILPMINLGIPVISSTIQVIIVVIIQLMINLWISNRINRYVPILNGSWNKR